jgi:hypothetical protein
MSEKDKVNLTIFNKTLNHSYENFEIPNTKSSKLPQSALHEKLHGHCHSGFFIIEWLD